MRKSLAIAVAGVLLLLLSVEVPSYILAGHGHGGGAPAPVSGTAAGDRSLIQGVTQMGSNSAAMGGTRSFKWGASHGQRYGQSAYRAPVSPDASEDQVNYDQKVKEDPFFERPHVPAATKAVIDNLIEKLAGVHSEERKLKAEQSVDKLADMGESASVKMCEYAEGQDAGLTLYCLKVMDKASFVRYEPILLNMLENRGDLPKDLGDASLAVFAKHADASTLSGLLRLIITEKNPAYIKDICPIVWKLQTPALWKRVLKYAEVNVNGDKDALALMELHEIDAQRRIAKVFAAEKAAADGAAKDDEDISIGLAKNGASDDSLARTIAAMVVAWSARPELSKPIDTMAHDSDDQVMFYGLVGQAHLRNEVCLEPLIDFLGSDRWDIRRDAQSALADLTGTTLDYDFAAIRADRVKGFARWTSFARLKNAAKGADYPASAGWKELPTRFVTEPRSVLFDTDTAFKSLGEAGTEFLTPGVVEGRWESIPVSNAMGKLPLHLAQQSSMLFRVDVTKHIVSAATVKDGTNENVNFERIATANLPTPTTPVGLGNKQPCALLKLDYNPLPSAARAYSFATYEHSTRTIPYMRAGYVEATFDDVTLRVYDDDNNGDFNDYGSDALQIAGQRYASLLSSVLSFGKTFYEFRISRSGDKMWVKPYEGALGSVHIKAPELNGFKVINLQVQSGSRVFDITNAVTAPMMLPVGKYQIVHAAVAVSSSRALITEGANGFFEIEANKVTEKAFANKLTVHVQPEVIDECDICSLKSKYPVPKGGQVLKIHVPYVEDGGMQTYGRFDSKLARIIVECTAPSGRKLFSSAWNAADDGFLPFFFVLQPRSMENGSYKISVKLDLAPFGQIKGEGSFSPPDTLVQVRP